MKRGKLHAGLLSAMFLIAMAAMVAFSEAGTDWSGGGMPNVSPTPVPPAPGAPTVRVSLPASPDTTAPKTVPVQASTECAPVQQVECVQTTYVPVRTVRYYNVASASPQYNVGCAGQAANVGCQRIGLFNRFRARRALFHSNARAYASASCGG